MKPRCLLLQWSLYVEAVFELPLEEEEETLAAGD